MGESRDANDPRDLMRAMDKETRAEFEEAEMSDTGGQEHATREDRGQPERRAEERKRPGQIARATAAPDDSEARVPKGDVATGADRDPGGSGDRG
ncbi:hypothetical protein [Anaeromyxobacter oryzae]|uniref:Uncharacterized protein n=1 Tax=Anaeromyxobacter oryzae TaxID=2918170 RepID=A0ABM7WNU2_9BACT|nr:hypothetical protein [Anaeromyxobacter oryzae]BDG01129.1 hypothetical protein AMOR_01250 [Anaeromyxobacter oryzae]